MLYEKKCNVGHTMLFYNQRYLDLEVMKKLMAVLLFFICALGSEVMTASFMNMTDYVIRWYRVCATV